MQAVILAAGMGKRLGDLTKDNTKCMIKVNDQRLIDRMLSQLSHLSLSRVVIVIGYEGQKLRDYIGDRYPELQIEYVVNEIYYRTNNIYSLYLAKDYLVQEDTLLLESDLIFEDRVLDKLLQNPYPTLALVDKYESWMDGTVITIDNDCNILRFISKKQFSFDEITQYHKTVNIYKFSKEFSASHYVPFLEAYSNALGNNEYYEQVLRVITLLDNPVIKALPLTGEKWYEIDDIQDLDIAESIFTDTDEEHYRKYTSRYGGYWRYPKMLDFCYLVNPYFPPQGMLDEMKANFDTLVREYPSGMAVNSLLAGKYFNIKQDSVVVGNGAAELIKALIEPIEAPVGVVLPTFEEYPNRAHKEHIVTYLPDNPEKSYTATDLMTYFGDKGLAYLVLINPDNPSGNYIPKAQVLDLIRWCGMKGIKLILDESFVDFSDTDQAPSFLQDDLLEQYPHLYVVKSISKSYGVPGLRLGVLASGDHEVIGRLKKQVAIWNINSFAEFYLQIFGKYESEYTEACQVFIQERSRFYEALQNIDFIRVIPSQANYFLCQVKPPFRAQELAIRLLKENNILIKDCGHKTGFGSQEYIRIAIRDEHDNTLLVKALKALQNS